VKQFYKEKEVKAFVEVPEIVLFTSIDSIATISAIGLLIEPGGGASLFDTAQNVGSYWGLHSMIKDSGDGRMVYKMSKKG
jgi:transposase